MEPSSAPWRVLETTEPETEPKSPETRTHGRPWLAIGAAILAVAVAAAAILFAARPEPVIGIVGAGNLAAGSIEQGGPPSMGLAAAARDLVVEVGGAVARPGIYRLAAGSRVGDAVAAAGGYGPRVDADAADRALNLAALVRDGDEIHVPARGEGAGASSAGSPGGANSAGAAVGSSGGGAGGPIDLNRATAEQLDTLPGVGPATAAKIIAAREERPFTGLDDFGSRKVVGKATLEKIRALVTVGR